MTQTPTSVLRRDLVMRLVGDHRISPFLEIGAGDGEFLGYLARHGHSGVGIDLSPQAVAVAQARLEREGASHVTVARKDLLSEHGSYRTVFAMEVFEHIEEDRRAFRHVNELLRGGGVLVLSVPAHPEYWDATDEVSGHVRRYERVELREKLEGAGFEDVDIRSLAVPLANWIRPVLVGANRRRLEAMDGEDDDRTVKTEESGLHPPVPMSEGAYRALFNRATLFPFLLLQRAFSTGDLGRNYVALARKPESPSARATG